MKRTFFQRILAAMVACLMLAGTLGAVTAAAEDWQETMIAVVWTDGEGNTRSQSAMPVEGTMGSFWVQVPAEALWGLTLQIESPGHAYLFTPENLFTSPNAASWSSTPCDTAPVPPAI